MIPVSTYNRTGQINYYNMINTQISLSIRRTYQFFSFLTLSCLWTLFTGIQAQAQVHFPSFEVLQKHQVKTMKVYRTPLRFQGGPNKKRALYEADLTPEKSIRYLETIYYFNEFGKVDSIIHNPMDSGYYKKDYFRYDDQHQLVEYFTIDKDGFEVQRELIQKQENNERLRRRWQYGNLRSENKVNADGIIYETLYYSPSDSTPYTTHSFDTESNLRIEYWENDLGEYRKETYQWFTENGEPKSFKHTLKEKTKKEKQPVYKEKVYELDSAGNVVNRYLGRFDDPYIQYNYFDRLELLEPIYYPEKERFRTDELIYKKELATLYTYDGIELVYLYELEYD